VHEEAQREKKNKNAFNMLFKSIVIFVVTKGGF